MENDIRFGSLANRPLAEAIFQYIKDNCCVSSYKIKQELGSDGVDVTIRQMKYKDIIAAIRIVYPSACSKSYFLYCDYDELDSEKVLDIVKEACKNPDDAQTYIEQATHKVKTERFYNDRKCRMTSSKKKLNDMAHIVSIIEKNPEISRDALIEKMKEMGAEPYEVAPCINTLCRRKTIQRLPNETYILLNKGGF